MIPDFLHVTLLALFAFRLTRLVGWDDLTIKPRRWVTGMGDEEHHQWAHVIDTAAQHGVNAWELIPTASWMRWHQADNPVTLPELVSFDDTYIDTPPVSERRYYFSKLVRCAWCAGWWISLAVVACWYAWPHVTTLVAVPFALSALVGLVAKNLDP